MISEELKKAATEVNYVLAQLDDDDIEKIPEGLRGFLKEIEDKEFKPNIDINVSLLEQNLIEETKQILGMMYHYYWDDERREISKNEKVIRNALFPKDLPDKLFKDSNGENELVNENRAMFEIAKNEPWYKKLFGWFKKKK